MSTTKATLLAGLTVVHEGEASGATTREQPAPPRKPPGPPAGIGGRVAVAAPGADPPDGGSTPDRIAGVRLDPATGNWHLVWQSELGRAVR